MSRHGSILLALGLVLAIVPLAVADVFLMTRNYNLEPVPDLQADFGPDLPDVGVVAVLRLASPEDACTPFTFTDVSQPWVALISRHQQLQLSLNCTFDIKVAHAAEAGAVAAIVYDDVYESLIVMSKPPFHLDPPIPSVFVTQKAGVLMRELMQLEEIQVRITPACIKGGE
ncbi:PA domain-containing protein [Haematococcus lacustris]|uniref:PA domain-containing protein n=1 Tax=Haematococcus lacustris TaxID=44745 RepID=A0A699ZXK1_HAELA|nr:PA domain-containing protein [Haematococcus lacustris]